MFFAEWSQRDSGLVCQMEERTNGNTLSFGLQTMRVLFVCLFPLIVKIKPTNAVIILPSVFSQSVHKRKTQFYPIFIIGCYINGTLLYFPDNMFHIFLYLII